MPCSLEWMQVCKGANAYVCPKDDDLAFDYHDEKYMSKLPMKSILFYIKRRFIVRRPDSPSLMK